MSDTRNAPRALLALIALVCWLIVTPQARATVLGSLLQHSLWAGPNAGDPLPQRTPSSPVGTLPGNFLVDDSGAARYSIPLEVPPAARGLEPELSLTYSSHSGNGPLGVGWSLSGQSAVTRCAHTLADDGEVTPVRMTDDDALCLDGARLILLEGTAFEPGATYRPKRDDFSRIRLISSDDTGADHCHGSLAFERRHRDGTISTYGCRRDATVTTHLGVRSWALSRVRDRFGNAIEYRYDFTSEPVTNANGDILGEADVEHVLVGIDYGTHLDLHASTRNVIFDWEPRPDPWQGWSLGAPQRQSQRLARVTTFAEGGIVHRYELDYATPSVTGRSLLGAVRQCDAKGVCKPATTFDWEVGDLGLDPGPSEANFADRSFPLMTATGDPDVVDPHVRAQTVLDADGDGRTDMLLAVGNGGPNIAKGRGWELWTSQVSAWGEQGIACGSKQPNFEQCAATDLYVVHEAERTGLLAAPTFEAPWFASPSLFGADYDGDGRDDAIALGDRFITPGHPPSGHTFYIVRSLAEGGVEQLEFDAGAGLIWWFSGADQTGDGLGDLLFCAGEAQLDANGDPVPATGSWMFVPNVPDEGFSANNRVDLGLPCSSYDKMLQLDHDGDGVSSLLVIPVWDTATKQWVGSSEWLDYQALTLDPHANWAASLVPTGLPPDLAQRWRSAISWPNDGYLADDFPRALQGFGIDRILDVNDDGLPDVLRYELTAGDTVADLGIIKKTIVGLDPPLPEWGGVKIWINTGVDFRDGGWLLESESAGDDFFRRWLASAVLDYDGDGRLDVVTPVDDPNEDVWDWTIWVSNGDGTFDGHLSAFKYPVQDYSLRARSIGAFDLDGDALHDFAVFTGGTWSLREHRGRVPDKLVRIENGLGSWIEVGYRSLTDFDAPDHFYEVDLDDCAYPRRCERDPRLVVEWHRLDNGDDGRRFEHRYSASRSDREGGQSLGFEWHETVELDEQQRPIHRRRVGYSHAYDPNLRAFTHTGVPATILVDRRDPETGRHLVTHLGRLFDHLETTPLTYHPYVSQEVTRGYELPSCAETFCEVADLDVQYRVSDLVDTVHELDEFGNPTLWTSTIDSGSTLLTYHHEAEHLNDEESWLLGLPTYERLTFLESGQESRERDSVSIYDPDTGALLTHIVEPTEPELFLHASYGYDAHGNLVSRKSTDMDGEQRSATVVYDGAGVFPIISTNALGQGSKMRWDPGLGVAIEATDPNGLRVVADHDGLGHLTGVRMFAGDIPRGDATTYEYKQLAGVIEIRSETLGHGYSQTRYDRLGREIEQRDASLDGFPRDVFTRYDRLGRVERVSLPTPLGQLPDYETFGYDFADRLVRHELADGTAQTWFHNGLETLHIDIGGSISVLEYDLAGRLIESTRARGTPDEERMCFDYGAFELLARARPDCVPRTPNMIDLGEAPPTIKTYEYDDLGRQIASDDPSEGPRSSFYNGHGELELYVDANENEVVFERDTLGRIVSRSDVDGITTWTWDLDFIGRVSASMSPDGHEELIEHDSFGRVETLTKVIGGENFDLGFDYDQFGRLSHIHYPQAEELPPFSVRNVYADNGELREVRSDLDDALLWQIEALDERGRVTRERFGNDAITRRSYDPLRSFTRTIETTSELGSTLQSLDYEWNHDGTLERREDLLHVQHETFEYDFLHRVAAVHTSTAKQTHSRHFAYDTLGNLVFASDRGEYEYDPSGRLAVADGSTHEWDQNGNLLARTGARAAEFSYTAFDKPATIDDDGALIEFEYDASQARVYRYSEADARETIYVTDLYQRHHDDESGETQHHYYVPGAERIVANVVDTVDFVSATRSTYYLHADHLGSTDVVSDKSGNVEQRVSFDVWGKRRDPQNWTLPDDFAQPNVANLGYTGHELQEDAGLVHMGGRLYDPHLGRMAGADPLVVDPSSTQGWNRYAYVLNQPLTLVDPSGFEPTETEGDPRSDNGAEKSYRGVSGVIGGGESSQGPPKGGSTPGRSTTETKTEPKADQQAGDRGPVVGESMASGGAAPNLPGAGEWVAELLVDAVQHAGNAIGPGVPPARHPLEGFTDSMVRQESPSQEQRRHDVANEVADRVIHGMQNPPAHVVISLELTMFFIGGDLELLGAAGQGLRNVVVREGADGALPLVAGIVRKESRKNGTAGGKRAGKPFTRKQKQTLDFENAQQNGGANRCEGCGVEVQPGERSRKGVSRPPTERNRDHIIPKSQKGDGDVSNGQILCLKCNLIKGDKMP